MIVWGGARGRSEMHEDGGRYAPATDSWLVMSNTGAPSARWLPAAVWTGSQMIVWGGFGARWGGPDNDGARYDPVADAWTAMSTDGAPAARGAPVAVWTGHEMLVWGGATNAELTMGIDGPLGDGGAYDPATDTWRALPTAGAPSARLNHTAVWTDTTMIVWGGTTATAVPAFDTGAIYDPATDGWTEVTTLGAPEGRRNHVAVWTGTEMIVWGGSTAMGGFTTNLNDGSRYRPR
jgi:N-acetylneuraminic acid mutarotase